MSYAIYKTQAIVLRTIPSQEANVDVVFLTRNLGKITVHAQAARKIESKMRMQLSRYHHVEIDVVRGAHIWRLTGIAEYIKHHLFDHSGYLHAFHRAATLAEHLIRGEDPHPELFDFFVNVMDYIDRTISGRIQHSDPVLAPEQNDRIETLHSAGALELYCVIKVLGYLGYWPGESFPESPNDEVFQKCIEQKTELVAMINESIRATQIT